MLANGEWRCRFATALERRRRVGVCLSMVAGICFCVLVCFRVLETPPPCGSRTGRQGERVAGLGLDDGAVAPAPANKGGEGLLGAGTGLIPAEGQARSFDPLVGADASKEADAIGDDAKGFVLTAALLHMAVDGLGCLGVSVLLFHRFTSIAPGIQ